MIAALTGGRLRKKLITCYIITIYANTLVQLSSPRKPTPMLRLAVMVAQALLPVLFGPKHQP